MKVILSYSHWSRCSKQRVLMLAMKISTYALLCSLTGLWVFAQVRGRPISQISIRELRIGSNTSLFLEAGGAQKGRLWAELYFMPSELGSENVIKAYGPWVDGYHNIRAAPPVINPSFRFSTGDCVGRYFCLGIEYGHLNPGESWLDVRLGLNRFLLSCGMVFLAGLELYRSVPSRASKGEPSVGADERTDSHHGPDIAVGTRGWVWLMRWNASSFSLARRFVMVLLGALLLLGVFYGLSQVPQRATTRFSSAISFGGKPLSASMLVGDWQYRSDALKTDVLMTLNADGMFRQRVSDHRSGKVWTERGRWRVGGNNNLIVILEPGIIDKGDIRFERADRVFFSTGVGSHGDFVMVGGSDYCGAYMEVRRTNRGG